MTRNKDLDFAKGGLILLVLFGHFIQYYVYHGSQLFWDDYIFKLIYIFHMPLFMAISGYIAALKLSDKSIFEVLVEKTYQLFIPILFWCTLWSLFVVLIKARSPFEFIALVPQQVFSSYWFLWAIIFSYLTVRMLYKIPGNTLIYIAVSAIVVLLVPIYQTTPALIKYTYFFFCAGYIVNRLNIHVALNKKYIAMLIIGMIYIYSIWNRNTYIYNNNLYPENLSSIKEIVIMLSGGIVFSIAAIYMFIYISIKFRNTKLWATITNDIGSKTLQIYLVQELLFRIMGGANFITFNNYFVKMIIGIALSFILAILIVMLVRISSSVRVFEILMWGSMHKKKK